MASAKIGMNSAITCLSMGAPTDGEFAFLQPVGRLPIDVRISTRGPIASSSSRGLSWWKGQAGGYAFHLPRTQPRPARHAKGATGEHPCSRECEKRDAWYGMAELPTERTRDGDCCAGPESSQTSSDEGAGIAFEGAEVEPVAGGGRLE